MWRTLAAEAVVDIFINTQAPDHLKLCPPGCQFATTKPKSTTVSDAQGTGSDDKNCGNYYPLIDFPAAAHSVLMEARVVGSSPAATSYAWTALQPPSACTTGRGNLC